MTIADMMAVSRLDRQQGKYVTGLLRSSGVAEPSGRWSKLVVPNGEFNGEFQAFSHCLWFQAAWHWRSPRLNDASKITMISSMFGRSTMTDVQNR
jgi:hypothetical protein